MAVVNKMSMNTASQRFLSMSLPMVGPGLAKTPVKSFKNSFILPLLHFALNDFAVL
jgi:hypothetical protein